MTTNMPEGDLVELVAELMHDAYELAAVQHGWATQERSRVSWADLPEANKMTMLTAVRAGLAPIIDALPDCVTCDGKGWTAEGHTYDDPYGEQVQCGCTGGKVDVFSALARLAVLEAADERKVSE